MWLSLYFASWYINHDDDWLYTWRHPLKMECRARTQQLYLCTLIFLPLTCENNLWIQMIQIYCLKLKSAQHNDTSKFSRYVFPMILSLCKPQLSYHNLILDVFRLTDTYRQQQKTTSITDGHHYHGNKIINNRHITQCADMHRNVPLPQPSCEILVLHHRTPSLVPADEQLRHTRPFYV